MHNCIIQDDDGHWYVVPTNKEKEAESWLTELYRSTEEGDGSDTIADLPDWMCPIDISYFTFDNWKDNNA